MINDPRLLPYIAGEKIADARGWAKRRHLALAVQGPQCDGLRHRNAWVAVLDDCSLDRNTAEMSGMDDARLTTGYAKMVEEHETAAHHSLVPEPRWIKNLQNSGPLHSGFRRLLARTFGIIRVMAESMVPARDLWAKVAHHIQTYYPGRSEAK